MTAGPTEITQETLDAEAEWMRQVARGDRRAAQRLVDAHLASITRFAYRMLGSSSEAEDVAQEVFLKLWRQAPSWEPRARLGTWLHRVAHNLCIDRLRSRREVRLSDPPDDPDSRPSAFSEIERHEAARAVHDAIQSLPERQRAALVLVYYQGLDNRQAAEVLGVHVDALESLLSRARRSLRMRLIESGGPVSAEAL
jgi:RNA polymerase sigma-70 factor (ECF subfamily)